VYGKKRDAESGCAEIDALDAGLANANTQITSRGSILPFREEFVDAAADLIVSS